MMQDRPIAQTHVEGAPVMPAHLFGATNLAQCSLEGGIDLHDETIGMVAYR